jgi:hypothetical protein
VFGCRRPAIAFIVLPPGGAPSQWRRSDRGDLPRPTIAFAHLERPAAAVRTIAFVLLRPSRRAIALATDQSQGSEPGDG